MVKIAKISIKRGSWRFKKMKVHRYQVEVYESALDLAHGRGDIQDRLYFPKQGVLGYRDGKIDFFSDDKEVIDKAERCIRGEDKKAKYLGEVEVGVNNVEQIVLRGKRLNEERRGFERAAKNLVDQLEK